MRGSNKKPGKRNLSGNDNELEEYFAGLESGKLDSDYAQSNPSSQGPVGLSSAEEVRRLTAYVAHLRERVSALLQSPTQTSAPRRFSNSVTAITGITVMVGVAAVLGMIARRWFRPR